jgi:hypothetical protein
MHQHQISIIGTIVIAHATNIARLNGYMNSGKPGTGQSTSPPCFMVAANLLPAF